MAMLLVFAMMMSAAGLGVFAAEGTGSEAVPSEPVQELSEEASASDAGAEAPAGEAVEDLQETAPEAIEEVTLTAVGREPLMMTGGAAPGTYTVTFVSKPGGKTQSISPVTQTAGKSFDLPVPPTASGYTFRGWYTSTAYTSKWKDGDVPTGNMTLYAKWDKVFGNVKASIVSTSKYRWRCKMKVTWNGPADGTYTVELHPLSKTAKTYRKYTVTGNSKTMSKVKAAGRWYYIKVTDSKGNVKWSSKRTTKAMEAPSAVKKLKAHPSYKGILLDWKPVKSASGYVIYRSGKPDSGFKKIGEVTNAKKYRRNGKVCFRSSGLKDYTTYYYKVYAYRGYEFKTGARSARRTASDQTVRQMHYRLTMKTTVTLKSTSGLHRKTFHAGSKYDAIRFDKGKYVYYDDKGYAYYVKREYTSTRACVLTQSFNYDRASAEDFINTKHVGSPTGKLVWVSTYTQHAYYFTGKRDKWTLRHSWEVATGKASTPTPTGLYGNKAIWKKIRSQHGLPYWSCFSSENGFHGKAGSWKVGTPASSGCIRCPNGDAQFVYEHMPKKSQVLIW